MSAAASRFAGYWEQAVFTAGGLRLAGWAARTETGEAPDCFLFTCGVHAQRFHPHVLREDVAGLLGCPPATCGFELVLPLTLDIRDDWSRPRLIALWRDGLAHTLPALPSERGQQFGLLEATDFESFQRHVQNPATRIGNPLVQAYAARRALRLAGDDGMFWMAAAVVALYRQIEGDLFPREEAALLISEWHDRRAALPEAPEGELMRWVGSMHLAAGYALLSWGELEAAKAEFLAILPSRARLASWPQMVGNLGIAMFMAGWIAWRQGDAAEARRILGPCDRLLREGTEALRIWSWHHFEELRNALEVAQQCFVLLKRIELSAGPLPVPPEAEAALRLAGTDWVGSILPRDATLSLVWVSGVLRRMVEAGRIEDGPFPPPPE